MRFRTIILCALAVFLVPSDPRAEVEPHSLSLLNGSTVVPALNYVSWTVRVDPTVMSEPRISGQVTASGGDGNDIEAYVLTDAGFVNWKNNHEAATLYSSGRVTVADLHAILPGEAGTYHVVLSNTFSTFTAKTVTGSIRLDWTPSPAVRNAILMPLLALLLIGIALGGTIVWAIMAQKKAKLVQAP